MIPARSADWRRGSALCIAAVAIWASAAAGCNNVFWRPDLGGAMRLAAQRDEVVLVYVWSPLNEDCMKMQREVFSHKDVRSILRGVICVRLDAALHGGFCNQYGLHNVPAFVIFAPDHALLRKGEGYMNEGRFRGFVASAALSR